MRRLVLYIRGLQTFLYEGHTSYCIKVLRLDVLHNVIVSGYVPFHQINECFVDIIFSLLTKMSCGRTQRLRGPNGIASGAGFDPRVVVWRPLVSGVTDRRRRASLPPWQTKCKNWASLTDILIFSILLVFSRLLFFAFFMVFCFFLAGID